MKDIVGKIVLAGDPVVVTSPAPFLDFLCEGIVEQVTNNVAYIKIYSDDFESINNKTFQYRDDQIYKVHL